MRIRFRCKSCGNKCKVDESLAGESFKCETCGAHMLIPSQSTDTNSVSDEDTAVEIPGNNRSEISTDSTATVKVFSVSGATQKSDDIKFECKICGLKYRLSKEFAGHEAECAKCKRTIIIPKYSDIPEGAPTVKITFWCKKCGQKYRLPQNYANQEAYCAKCKTTFIVPAKSEDAPPDANGNDAVTSHGRPPAEHAEWRPSPVPKYPTEALVPEKVQPPSRTRAQVVQEVMAAKSLQTQTSIEITGNPVSMVRYVLASPDSNILATAFSALINWIRQFTVFKGFSRKFIGFAIIVFCIAAAAAIATKLYAPAKKPETRLVNTMCLDCKFIEPRTISNINATHCSKCKSETGYAWKCFKCGKVFSREVSKANGDVLLLEKIRTPECPICNSDNVKYIPPEQASGTTAESKSTPSKR